MPSMTADFGARVDAVKAIAKGLCQTTGPAHGCYCRGEATRCFALKLHEQKSVEVVLALEKAGLELVRRPPGSP